MPGIDEALRRSRTEQNQQLQRERSIEQASERARQVQAPSVSLDGAAAEREALSTQLPVGSPCFGIARVQLSVPEALPASIRALGASALPMDTFRFAQEYLDQYAGQCIGRDGVNIIVRRLGAQILGRGYTTTRVAVPEQDLSTGVLHLALIPGVIRQIRFADDTLHGSWQSAFPARPGDLLNVRDLEQGLEQMKRVPSQDVEMQLVPGELPGESDVVITVRRTKAWKVIASLDDSGNAGTGKLQGNLSLGIDNPLGLNDLFNIGVGHDANVNQGGQGTRGANAFYSVPWGNWTFAASANIYDYFQRIAGVNQVFESSGNSKNAEFKAAYLFQRDQFQKNSLQVRIGHRWSHAFIEDTEILNQQRSTTFAEIGWLHRHYFGAAQLDLSLAYRFGVPWLNGQTQVRTIVPDAPSQRDKFLYRIGLLDATLSVPFAVPLSAERRLPLRYTTTFHGQYSDRQLLASEFLSIGNRWTVRGFSGDVTLAAERGFYWRNDLEAPLGNSGHSVYMGLDAGSVSGPSAAYLPGKTLAGTAIGLRGSPVKGLYYDVFLGWALYKPDGFPTRSPAGGFSLTYQY
ncbi:ShlB/FhaC/HecB family hemolysin secretion/activation protein [Cupriavidus oxalaticus]|nr:ShlB/FhaC/HecB family hemolysin secretion/activation protein [Cupriavidus oxalaticus]WQD84808.1 ShlB/FhaC/HecB family hemolysin secretion/activation protein [Cupriavidus oxalaticus]